MLSFGNGYVMTLLCVCLLRFPFPPGSEKSPGPKAITAVGKMSDSDAFFGIFSFLATLPLKPIIHLN